jgi:hypothetical protein
MKRIFMLALALAGVCSTTLACDICGYGVANYNPFLFPHLSRSYISLSYQHRLYYVHNEDDGTMSREYYNAFTLSAQYAVTKKLQLIALLPYQVNKLNSTTANQSLNGLGDATVVANYKVWDKQFGLVRHTVMGGVGVKLPTGEYKAVKNGSLDDQNFQLGTGSTDYLANASYRIGYRKWIVNAAASYKYNNTNKGGYRYGDMLTTGASIIYRKDWDGFSVAPYVQVSNDHQLQDADNHIIQDHSGGHVLYTGGGVDMNTRRVAFGLNYQCAANQNLAEGHIRVKPKLSAHLSFVL